jgi:UDPglucose--hexose-1-phosphate uridylyltransferase
MVVAPTAHEPDLPSMDGSSRDALATVLVDVLGHLDRLFAAPMPYMLWIHQRPTDGRLWPAAHVHAEISPLLRAPGVQRYVAGAELGSGMLINPVVPEEAAAALRDA